MIGCLQNGSFRRLPRGLFDFLVEEFVVAVALSCHIGGEIVKEVVEVLAMAGHVAYKCDREACGFLQCGGWGAC